MAYWDIGLKHIVDVDGQLLAIDAESIDVDTLLERAALPSASALWLVRAGQRFLLHPQQSVQLPHDEVLFFESQLQSQMRIPMRLAA